MEMTKLESLLKICYEQRPDVHGRVLTPDELTEYIGWMAAEFGNRPGFRVRADAIADMKDAKLSELGRRLLDDPGDAQAFRQLYGVYRAQKEEQYISADHDISVAHTLRYMPAHWHANDYFEVFYAFSGDCPIHFANEIVTLRPGAVLIVAPGVVHATPCCADDADLEYYMLRSSTFDRVFWSLIPRENLMAAFFRQALSRGQPNAYLHFETNADADIRRLMEHIYREYLGAELYSAQMMNALMSACFTLLLRRYEGSARLPRTEGFFWKHEYSAILSDIQTRFATVKLPELAARYHYSEKQIGRIVKNCTDMSFSELITKLRMEKAAALLRQEGASTSAIASALGYTTVSSFYRAFTGYYGCTPRKYAEEHPA